MTARHVVEIKLKSNAVVRKSSSVVPTVSNFLSKEVKKKEIKKNKPKITRLSSLTRFVIIITTFLVQWIPCCLISFITDLPLIC
jgi:hypothetical protein